MDEGLVQLVPVGAPDHQQVDVVRGGAGLAGRPGRPRPEDRRCRYALQSAEFFPEDLGWAESDGDEVAQWAVEGRFLVCPD